MLRVELGRQLFELAQVRFRQVCIPAIGRAELEIFNFIHDHHPVRPPGRRPRFLHQGPHANDRPQRDVPPVPQGVPSRKRVYGVYLYSPSVHKADLLCRLVGDFVNKALGGSLSPFVAYLAKSPPIALV